MTKKDYEMIAQVIKDNTEWVRQTDSFGETLEEKKIEPSDLYISLGLAFAKDNPNFDKIMSICEEALYVYNIRGRSSVIEKKYKQIITEQHINPHLLFDSGAHFF